MNLPVPFSPRSTIPELNSEDYFRFSRLVEERYGLFFSDKRRIELERGVWQAYAASTCSTTIEFFDLLQDPVQGTVHRERLVNALTICETHFFRDEAQFDALLYHVLPKIIERRRSLKTIRIWSAGCASGEEPYSIAILLRELLPDVDEWSITIIGTDINTQALDKARKAVYGEWAFREERAKNLRARYFRSLGDRYELVPEVRRMVTFQRLNLVEDTFPSYATNTTYLDMILCRNVTIYFPEAITRKIIERLYECTLDEGWLVVGHSEPSLFMYRRFHVVNFPNTVLYQRISGMAPQPLAWEENELKNQPQPLSIQTPPSLVRPVQPPPLARPSVNPRLSPPPQPPKKKSRLEQAQDHLNFGRSEKAYEVLIELASQQPTQVLPRVMLGKALANLGRWDEAEKWCREAIQLSSLAIEAYYTLALVLQHQSKVDEAVAALKKVVYIDRKHILGHFGLADLCYGLGQVSFALKSLDNAARLLAQISPNEVIPGSDGITAGRLHEVVINRQQQWSSEAA